jgi:hypothetical protein
MASETAANAGRSKFGDTLRNCVPTAGAAGPDWHELRRVSPDFWQAATANEANGSAPAGESPTSTAAHAAATLPRMIIGLA